MAEGQREMPLQDGRPDDLVLRPGERYRRVFAGPLERRSLLIAGLICFGALSLLGAWAAFRLGTLWAAFIPIPCAIGFGIFAAGMWPNWFFGRNT